MSPDSWKPIAWLNQGHYDVLRKKNVLAGPLAQRIEVNREVAQADEQAMCARRRAAVTAPPRRSVRVEAGVRVLGKHSFSTPPLNALTHAHSSRPDSKAFSCKTRG